MNLRGWEDGVCITTGMNDLFSGRNVLQVMCYGTYIAVLANKGSTTCALSEPFLSIFGPRVFAISPRRTIDILRASLLESFSFLCNNLVRT